MTENVPNKVKHKLNSKLAPESEHKKMCPTTWRIRTAMPFSDQQGQPFCLPLRHPAVLADWGGEGLMYLIEGPTWHGNPPTKPSMGPCERMSSIWNVHTSLKMGALGTKPSAPLWRIRCWQSLSHSTLTLSIWKIPSKMLHTCWSSYVLSAAHTHMGAVAFSNEPRMNLYSYFGSLIENNFTVY